MGKESLAGEGCIVPPNYTLANKMESLQQLGVDKFPTALIYLKLRRVICFFLEGTSTALLYAKAKSWHGFRTNVKVA